MKYFDKNYWVIILYIIIIIRGGFKEKIKIKIVDKIVAIKKKFKYLSYIIQDHNAISVIIPRKNVIFCKLLYSLYNKANIFTYIVY